MKTAQQQPITDATRINFLALYAKEAGAKALADVLQGDSALFRERIDKLIEVVQGRGGLPNVLGFGNEWRDSAPDGVSPLGHALAEDGRTASRGKPLLEVWARIIPPTLIGHVEADTVEEWTEKAQQLLTNYGYGTPDPLCPITPEDIQRRRQEEEEANG